VHHTVFVTKEPLRQKFSTTKIENNNIGSVTIGSSTGASNLGQSFYAIAMLTGSTAIKNNNIGSSSTANSIQILAASPAITSNASILGAISLIGTSASTDSVVFNNIYNLTNFNAGTNTRVYGINAIVGATAPLYIIDDNTVRNLTATASASVGTTNSAAVFGIAVISANTGLMSVSRNRVYALENGGSGASAWTTGIHYSGGTNTSNAVEGNFVHSLTPSTGASANVCGIQLAGGTVTNARNNMVRLGWNAVGDSITQAHNIYGIEVTSTSATNVFHNSIYIGGLVAGTGAPNSFAFRRTATSGTINIQNNIFVNERTQSSGGKHYCMYTPNTTTYTSDYNILFDPASNNNSPGLFNATEAVSLAQWRTLTGNRDLNSSACDPAFENPTGNAANVDLHLNDLTGSHLNDLTGSAAEGRGNPVALSPAVTLDYDGETRATPALGTVDVGADAGDYIGLVGPTLAPEANGETTLTLCAGGAVVFTANATGGSTLQPVVQHVLIGNTLGTMVLNIGMELPLLQPLYCMIQHGIL